VLVAPSADAEETRKEDVGTLQIHREAKTERSALLGLTYGPERQASKSLYGKTPVQIGKISRIVVPSGRLGGPLRISRSDLLRMVSRFKLVDYREFVSRRAIPIGFCVLIEYESGQHLMINGYRRRPYTAGLATKDGWSEYGLEKMSEPAAAGNAGQ